MRPRLTYERPGGEQVSLPSVRSAPRVPIIPTAAAIRDPGPASVGGVGLIFVDVE